MALVSPLLIAMLFGIIDFSRVFNAELQLSQAAREGARIASLQLGTLDTVAVQNRAVLAATNPAFGAALPTSGVTVQGCSASPSPTGVATVTVTYNFHGFMFMTN